MLDLTDVCVDHQSHFKLIIPSNFMSCSLYEFTHVIKISGSSHNRKITDIFPLV